jgi:polysaccharide deacetylase family protein (PEP-CTERM system associated)
MLNVLTIDVEEYFHPTELAGTADLSRWSVFPSRIEAQVQDILELLDSRKTTATFFILGWVAEHHPKVVREIAAGGHEIACHSHLHRLIYDLSPSQFREDTQHAVMAIEDACGVSPRSYRAPSFSITTRSMWALEILAENGFTHDSSIYPIVHDRYGIPGFRRHAQMLQTASGPIYEVPVATARISSYTIAPVGGGAYLRLLPYRYTAAGIRRLNDSEQQPACIYFHPWEFDLRQPRLGSGRLSKLRTYTGIAGMKRKVEKLLSEFCFSSLASVYHSADTPACVQRAGA